MKFSELDQKMRVYETARDYRVPPRIFLVARLDGRNFTRLTKEVCDFRAPFDERFRDVMMDTAEHLMDCGFNVIFAYIQSDEISLLFHPDEVAFGRKIRKYNSILAGEASARISMKLGIAATFDCRLCEIPNPDLVVDYFRWRGEDAYRNALSAHAYWVLRRNGVSARQATAQLDGVGKSGKNELLFENGINFNDLPTWQKRGVGLYRRTYFRDALNPVTGKTVRAERRRIFRDRELSMGEQYADFVRALVAQYDQAA